MAARPSARIAEFVAALPLRPGMRVLEVGCGPGVAARLALARIGNGHVLAIDRSARAISLARAGSRPELASGRLEFRQAAIEHFALEAKEAPFDLAFAMRVGSLDGRHPQAAAQALAAIAGALTPKARLFIDGGDPLKELMLPKRSR
jgi:SAM-dependent methyltransferase